MKLKFYIAFFRLADEERRAFEELAEDDELIQKTIADCAVIWRESIRQIHTDPIQCRHVFLLRALLIMIRRGLNPGYGMNFAAAFALYICDRVEQRVRALDFEAEQLQWRFRQ